ncbi:hypothetical protein QU500_002260 [Cronobacter sakazakii]|nr:hypothetical protein [Cronobacter sakazakii]
MKAIPLILASLLVAGCSTDVVPLKNAVQAPYERLYKYQNEVKNDATLTVIRDAGITGSACYAAVYIDGERVASLATKEKATFHVPAGDRAIGAGFEGEFMCNYKTEPQERYINLESGKSKVVRIFTDYRAQMDIKATTL